jgi:hypothetical protein
MPALAWALAPFCPLERADVLRLLIGQTDPLTERAQTWIASE